MGNLHGNLKIIQVTIPCYLHRPGKMQQVKKTEMEFDPKPCPGSMWCCGNLWGWSVGVDTFAAECWGPAGLTQAASDRGSLWGHSNLFPFWLLLDRPPFSRIIPHLTASSPPQKKWWQWAMIGKWLIRRRAPTLISGIQERQCDINVLFFSGLFLSCSIT